MHIGRKVNSREIRHSDQNSSPTISFGLLGITEHLKGTASPFSNQKQFLLFSSTALLIADRSKETEWSKRGRKGQLYEMLYLVSRRYKTIPLECSVILN